MIKTEITFQNRSSKELFLLIRPQNTEKLSGNMVKIQAIFSKWINVLNKPQDIRG